MDESFFGPEGLLVMANCSVAAAKKINACGATFRTDLQEVVR